jgi:hypothetical protein
MKKVKESMKSSGGTDDVKVPSLWYFDELDFLRDQETQIQGISTIDETEFIEGNNETEVQWFISIHTNTNSFLYKQYFIQRIHVHTNNCRKLYGVDEVIPHILSCQETAPCSLLK